jgi:anti-sigma factor RsiW
MTQPSFRDVETLTAYLDRQLDSTQRQRLESRLQTDPEWKVTLDALRESRSVLRKLPQRRAPRNFTLTLKMAGIKPPLPRAYPILRFASAFAGFLFLFAYAANLLPNIALPLGAAAPAMEMQAAAPAQDNTRNQSGGGCDTCTVEATMEVEAPLAPSAKVAPTEQPVPSPTLSAEVQTQPPDTLGANRSTVENKPFSPPAPSSLQEIVLAVAVLAGLAALIIRLSTERAFTRKNKAG